MPSRSFLDRIIPEHLAMSLHHSLTSLGCVAGFACPVPMHLGIVQLNWLTTVVGASISDILYYSYVVCVRLSKCLYSLFIHWLVVPASHNSNSETRMGMGIVPRQRASVMYPRWLHSTGYERLGRRRSSTDLLTGSVLFTVWSRGWVLVWSCGADDPVTPKHGMLILWLC